MPVALGSLEWLTPATPEAAPLFVSPRIPFAKPPEVPVLVAWIAAVPVLLLLTLSLPAIVMAPLLWLIIESLTLALPPLLEKRGTKPVLQAALPAHRISFGCSAAGWTLWLLPLLA